MPPALLTVATIMTCPHGGTVLSIPGQHQVTASGALVLRRSDTFVVTGCPFTVAGVPNPCVSVQWVVTATRLKVCGDLVLNEASVGLCLSAAQAPQGPVMIVLTQQTVRGE